MPCGYRAIDALRLEKGYRAWATDITPDTTPDEAGLGFAVKPDKGVDFIGRDARRRAAAPPARRRRAWCASCWTSRAPIALGSEPVRRADGEVARAASRPAATASRSRASIAWAWLPAEATAPGTRLEVDIFGDWVGAEVRAEPLYDPPGERIRS